MTHDEKRHSGCCPAMAAFAQPKAVFMITDAEGVAGVCRQAQTDPKDSEMRQLLTGDINAAVAGFSTAALPMFSSGIVMMAVQRFQP